MLYAEPATETESKPVARYVPPSMRGQQGQDRSSKSLTPMNSRWKKKIAPNLQSEEDFPTLGGGPGQPGLRDE